MDRPIIYMYLETIDSIIEVDNDVEDFAEALHRCGLYFNKNPHDYLINCYNKWFVYDPERKSTMRVA